MDSKGAPQNAPNRRIRFAGRVADPPKILAGAESSLLRHFFWRALLNAEDFHLKMEFFAGEGMVEVQKHCVFVEL